MSKHLIVLFFLLSPIFFSGIASATTLYLYTCQVLSAGTPDNPNVYILQNNISAGGSVCFGTLWCLDVQNNTILDLNGYSITGEFYCGIGDIYNYGVVVSGSNVTIKNGYVNALIYGGFGTTRGSFAIATGGTENILIQNVTARAESYHYLSHYSHAINAGGNITIVDSIFTSDVCCAGKFSGGNYGRVTNSLFNTSDTTVDIWLTSNNFYIRACFDVGSISNTGINNEITRTCPAPSSCSCTVWVTGDCFNSTHRTQTRTCDPTSCDTTSQYLYDQYCASPMPPESSIFFNKHIILVVFVFGISIAIAQSVGGSDKLVIFLTVMGVLLFMLSVVGLFPKWVIVFAIVAMGGIFAKIMMSLFGK